MEEKWPLVSSQDYGGDETATIRLIKKHQVVCAGLPRCGLDWGGDRP